MFGYYDILFEMLQKSLHKLIYLSGEYDKFIISFNYYA